MGYNKTIDWDKIKESFKAVFKIIVDDYNTEEAKILIEEIKQKVKFLENIKKL